MKSFFLTAMLFLSAFTQAQIVTIPDANFKSALVNLKCVDLDGDGLADVDADTNNDGEIQVTEAQSILRLHVIGQSISSLEGIEEFTNLELLWCWHNQLSSLDLSQSPNLEELICNSNHISNLDITQNPNLKKLVCYGNYLSSLNLTQNLNLEYLGMSTNKFSSFDISQNVNLKFLNCSGNPITSLDLYQNLNLEELLCFDVGLMSLDLSQNPNLNTVICDDNYYLNSLNIANGNNENLLVFLASDNPSLTCIDVDDVNFANNQKCSQSADLIWCKDLSTVYSEDCSLLGLEDTSSESFKIFPNPAQNTLNVVTTEIIQSIKIYSIQGKFLKEALSNTIDISSLSSGIYFAQISMADKLLTKQFIKF